MLCIHGLNELFPKIVGTHTLVLKFPQNKSFTFRFIKTVVTKKAKKKNDLCVIFVYLVNQFAYSR